jgi:cell division septum initiation protein DivIVA
MSRDLASILDALEQAVEQARSMPMSSSVLVSRAEVLDLIGQLRAALPTQLADADELLATAAEVHARAHAEAEQVVAAAHRRADELVSADQVVAAAGARAAEIVSDAERTADQLRREADDYCDRRLADFEIDLGRLLSQVQAGRAKLAGRLGGTP